MESSKHTLSWIIAVVVGISIAVTVFFATGGGERDEELVGGVSDPATESASKKERMRMAPGPGPSIELPDEPTAMEKLDGSALNPDELMEDLRKAIEAKDLVALKVLLPDDGGRAALESFLQGKGLRVDPNQAMVELGEIDGQRRVRWGLNLLDAGGRRYRLDFDLERGEDAQWRVGRVRLPSRDGESVEKLDELADALGAAAGFLRSTLAQEFEKARFYVDPETVSDASIAGVCILFEEGAYALRGKRPVRNLFVKAGRAGFVAKVVDPAGAEVGDIGMTLRKHEDGAWRIQRIALDALLRDYASRQGGGDIYYTPLVRNPEGGSSIALYFGFDDAELSERSRRQLRIVAGLLKVDSAKRIKISGHADALGSEDYNLSLSRQRAKAVRSALLEFGLGPEQVEIQALGMSQPRRPNFLEDGTDNEQGRRVNRRAEIYLDF